MTYKIPISVLVILFTRKYEILLMERADRPGFWQSVTGSKETVNEELSETARREVYEETGLAFESDEYRYWNRSFEFEIYRRWRFKYAPGVIHNNEHVFSVLVDHSVDVRLSTREHLSFRWVKREVAIKEVFSWTNSKALRELPNYHIIEKN